MQSIRFQPVSNLILIPIKVIGIDGKSFRDIEVKALTAIGQTIENIEVICLDLPPEIHAEGVLGLNFLLNFDVNISFSKGYIQLVRY